MTIGVAVLAIFILPDWPATTKWLTPRERALAVRRLARDAGGIEDENGSVWKGARDALCDYKGKWSVLVQSSGPLRLTCLVFHSIPTRSHYHLQDKRSGCHIIHSHRYRDHALQQDNNPCSPGPALHFRHFVVFGMFLELRPI